MEATGLGSSGSRWYESTKKHGGRIARAENGSHTHTIDVWDGPKPTLTHRVDCGPTHPETQLDASATWAGLNIEIGRPNMDYHWFPLTWLSVSGSPTRSEQVLVG